MASEDVIELGSSDDEAEPAPKKIKSNAMVHIPRKISGAPIEATKPSLPSLRKKLSGRSVVIKKIPNTSAAEVKINRNILRRPACLKPRHIVKPFQKPIPIKQVVNPINVKISNSQVAINKVTPTHLKETRVPSKLVGASLSSLPPSITIRKASSVKCATTNTQNKINKNIKILPKAAVQPKIVLNPVASKSSVGDVLTVELDDDEDTNPGDSSTNGPHWYLTPEEQYQREKTEVQNNTEPQTPKFLEITIEDSPVKPVHNTHEIGAEFAITIEDSPIKFTKNRNESNICSDEENKMVYKTPKTKKKLEYPKNSVNNNTKTVEIEIEPMEVDEKLQEINKHETVRSNNVANEVQQILPQIKEKASPEMPTKTIVTEMPQPLKSNEENNENNEFHPVYQKFIDLCFELENSDDMQKIVDKKIKGYYRQVPKEYRESEEFLDMVSSKIVAMKAGPERMYLYIKDVVDELNFKRKSYKNSVITQNPVTNDKEAENFFYGEESEFDSKRQRQIRKLEKTLKKLHRAVQKLEEQEVDFDDEEDSVYLLTERYKERMIRVHAKFCQLTNTKMPSEPRVHIDARPGQPAGPVKRLEKTINKKVPIGTPLPFPDFHDVLRCVREANEEDKLGWNEADIVDEARDLFIRCGKKLKRRRQENEWRLAASRIQAEVDPAADSEELKKKLEQNRLLAIKKETELFNRYADKQNQMKLEAVEIGDKEAEESPVESEDDDIQEEDASLENSEKRKERLKRLLQEKYTKENEKNDEPSTSDVNKEIQLNDESEKQSTDINTQNEECTIIKIKSVESLSKTINIDDDKVQSLSDDSCQLNSDMDELHLLQKLHSENEANDSSTQNSSDSYSLIAISDSLDSDSDSKKRGSEDVISIENSSYSEPETNEVENVLTEDSTKCSVPENLKVANNVGTESSTPIYANKNVDKSNNDEYSESVENILLASSDEECDSAKKGTDNTQDACGNLDNDMILKGENVVDGSNGNNNTGLKEGENYTSSKHQSDDIPPQDDAELHTDGDDLTQLDLNSKPKSNEPVVIENRINDCKENNTTSAIADESVNVEITSDAVKEISDDTLDKQNAECDSMEGIVGSSTEAMEVVTTTSCDDVNGPN